MVRGWLACWLVEGRRRGRGRRWDAIEDDAMDCKSVDLERVLG